MRLSVSFHPVPLLTQNVWLKRELHLWVVRTVRRASSVRLYGACSCASEDVIRNGCSAAIRLAGMGDDILDCVLQECLQQSTALYINQT